MTGRGPIRVEADGTRVYSNHVRYKPVAPEKRKYASHKPDDPRAVRYNAHWFLPLELLPESQRTMPKTRPDEDGYDHRVMCRCDICRDNEQLLGWKQLRLGSRSRVPGAPRPRELLLRDAGTAD